MYLAKVHLVNWRSYADALFEFPKPTDRKPVVLIGAMNGHGKTSFLVSLYLGLFGRFGLRYCEGFRMSGGEEHREFYRSAIAKCRRVNAPPDEPTIVDLTFAPTLRDPGETEIRVVRRWHFTSANQPKPKESLEEVELYIGSDPVRRENPENAINHIEQHLFPSHVAPAFFFDGEQAQDLIENMGDKGLKRAVEVMFGTKVLEELSTQLRSFITRSRNDHGGKRASEQLRSQLHEKRTQREHLNDKLATIQKQKTQLEDEKEHLERERHAATESLTRLGGSLSQDTQQAQAAFLKAQEQLDKCEKELRDAARGLGLALALARWAEPIKNRLKAEALREEWESLKKGTIAKKEAVLAVALPEPPDRDPLLGHLAPEIRQKVRERFAAALEQIYEPPPDGCAQEYLLGHVKGDMRTHLLDCLDSKLTRGSAYYGQLVKAYNLATVEYEQAKLRFEQLSNLPRETEELRTKILDLNAQINNANQRLGALENEEVKLKGDLRNLNAEIGALQERLRRLEPEQQRIAVAERTSQLIAELIERLKPVTSSLLEDEVSSFFTRIADKRFAGGRIRLPAEHEPVFEFPDRRSSTPLPSLSGFEKRSFAIAFSLALAKITGRRVPLVIDTPLGNADSKYRPRALRALTECDLDQVIILTHDKEVTPDLVEGIKDSVCHQVLVEFDRSTHRSLVYPNRFFEV